MSCFEVGRIVGLRVEAAPTVIVPVMVVKTSGLTVPAVVAGTTAKSWASFSERAFMEDNFEFAILEVVFW